MPGFVIQNMRGAKAGSCHQFVMERSAVESVRNSWALRPWWLNRFNRCPLPRLTDPLRGRAVSCMHLPNPLSDL